jgi:GTPase Era involved in 16S rRNA processing
MTTLAIAGHANLGKTTLLRTLTKLNVGTVEDRAGATQEAETTVYSTIHASFVDTPGLTRASGVLVLLSHLKMDIAGLPAEYRMERIALTAIRSSDVVIYVCSYEIVPSDEHRDELRLIMTVNPRVVAILNKRRQQTAALGKVAIAKREIIWRQTLQEVGVEDIIDFDAHWDRYTKVLDLFRSCSRYLPSERRSEFADRVAEFDQTLMARRSDAAKLGSGTMLACRQVSEVAETEKENTDVSTLKRRLRERVSTTVIEKVSEYATELQALYDMSVQTSNQTLGLSEAEIKRASDRIGSMASHSGVGIGIGTIVGISIGAFIAGPLGAILGAKIGAGVGAGGGLASGAIVETNTRIEIRVTNNDLREIALFCLAVLWCVTHQGFGKDATVILADFEDALAHVKKEIKSIRHPDWAQCTEGQRIAWFDQSLSTLDA